MGEWWTYSAVDFLAFTPHTYYRLLELYNSAIWPLHILALILGGAIVGLIYSRPPWQGRAISILLALCWLWVAWAYHWRCYASINWAAVYFAWAFALQALLLLWDGVLRGKLSFMPVKNTVGRVGLMVFLYALIAQPMIAPLQGRSWTQAEVFALAPDPTTLASLGLSLLMRGKTFWRLLLIPLLWCLITGATLWAMKSPDALVTPLIALAVVVLAKYKSTLATHN